MPGVVRLRANWRTASRGAIDGEVDAWVVKRRTQDPMLDVVEREFASGGFPFQPGPYAVDLANAVLRRKREPAALNRVVIHDRGDRERVVGVDPKGEASWLGQPRLRARGGRIAHFDRPVV